MLSPNRLQLQASSSLFFGNLETQLADLKPELEKLDALLCSAPVHLNRNAILRPWLKRVKEAANFGDNLLEDISYERLRRQAESTAVSNILLCGSDGSLAFRIKIGRKISKFISMIDEIYNQGFKIGLRPVELVANLSSYQPPVTNAMSADLRKIRENVDTSGVVGREADEELIVPLLESQAWERQLWRIYDNDFVTEQYKKKIWIFVSDDFDLRRFLAEMLQSLTTGVNTDASMSSVPNKANTGAMETRLKECLEKERYLLVLDDVWNTNQQRWESIRSSLVRIANGCTGTSMVLVTTQLQEVASVMDASLSYDVKLLSEADSWKLFKSKAFFNESPKQVSDLEDIGEKILNKCRSLPLAINTLASLLATMNEGSQWESVERSQLWNLPESQTTIMPWLLLSFNQLPEVECPAIKQCFAYCSILIPKGKYVQEVYLISSWIAQGFIQLSEISDEDMLAIGRPYIKSMLAHGLLQLNTGDGNNPQYSLHDILRDLADYVSWDECLTISKPGDIQKSSSGAEHVMIYGGSTFNSQLNFPKGNAQSTLRTLICHKATISIDLVVQARFLRQLNLIDCGLTEIPRSIERLKRLRRLRIVDNPIKYLPDSIGSLYNLQALGLLECHRLFELPQHITKLLNLRWIETTEAVHIPKGLGQLTRLTWVPPFRLKVGDGCRIKELGSLKYLIGILTIEQLENVSCKEEAMEADLKRKAGIEIMKLGWSSEGNEGDIIGTNDEEVMEGLQPHSNLKQLVVRNFRGKRLSLWLSSGLYCINLTHLTLVNCKRSERLPTLGCLPCLKILHIEGMESVEVIGNAFFFCFSTGRLKEFFPNLIHFQMENMPKLKEWFDPSGTCASAFPCLEKLKISNCPLLVSVPSCFHSLQNLVIKGVNSGEPLLMILSNSYKLTSLWVENVQRLTCLSEPLLKCTSLRILRIIDCKDLVELPPTLQSMGCLKTLTVRNCDSLTSLPCIEGLLSLSELEIDECEQITDPPCDLQSCVSIEVLFVKGCPNLNFSLDLAILSRLRCVSFYDLSKQMSVLPELNQLSNLMKLTVGGFNNELDNFLGIEHLPKSLKILNLIGWPKLKSLPDELQSLTQLETLALWDFDGMTALPECLGSLSFLQSLEIWNCKNMKHLPSFDAMRRLTRLGELKIKECPLLEERCRKEGGEEWLKISHIPNIQIKEAEAADEGTRSRSRLTVVREALSGWVKRRVGLEASE